MGQYRLAIYSNLSFGIGIEYFHPHSARSISIRLPFLLIYKGLEKHATGFFFVN